ncbi:MAG: SpoIID/LytB domain-containing protein [Armatimonadetes bacterium]|nr:SpoIID/LytB domain-containing protein [Armatimonadota bacterium]
MMRVVKPLFPIVILLVTLQAVWAQDLSLVRVGLLFDVSSCAISCDSGLVLRTDAGNQRLPSSFAARPAADGIDLGGVRVSAPALTVHPADGQGPLRLNGREYRGDLVLIRGGDGLTVVNYVDIDAYIMGVLAGEVPASWPDETLRAQAVAARSYALNKMAMRTDAQWDVVATDRDQVYEGVQGEVPAIIRAVQATRGEVLTWQGQVVKAYFSASCGGHTEDVAVAFGENNAPFLKGVKDPYCANSPYQQWGQTYTVAELRRILSRSGASIGPVLAVHASKRSGSGRVEEFTVVHSGGRQVLPGVELRRLLGYRELRSTRFDIAVTRSIPVTFTTTRDEWKKLQKTEVYHVPESIEVGMEETNPVNHTVKPEDSFYVISASGNLEKNRAGYAFAATDAGLMRTFAMRPGLSVLGVERDVVVTQLTVRRRKERTTAREVKEIKKEIHVKKMPVVLKFTGRGWGHGVGLCQWGARGMGAQGFDYREILAHYYPGTQIKNVRSMGR